MITAGTGRADFALMVRENSIVGIFRLEPIDGTQTSHHWRASTLAPVTVWVEAGSEMDAREKLTLATIIATFLVPGHDLPMAPWKDFGLVRCVPDDSRNVHEGNIITADGRTLVIADQ